MFIYRFILILIISFIGVFSTSFADDNAGTLAKIVINGLTRTNTDVVTRELLVKQGDPVDRDKIEQSIQRLRNLRIFSSVDWYLREEETGKFTLIIQLAERWTLIPVAKFIQGGETQYYVLGLYNVNSFGRYLETGAQYESWNNQGGGVIWFREPRFMGQRIKLGADVWSVKRPRALYAANGDEQGSYISLRRRLNVFLEKEFSDRVTFGLAAERIEDSIIATDNEALLEPSVKNHIDNFNDPKNLRLTLRALLGKLNHHSEFVQGRSVELSAGFTNESLGSSETFHNIDLDAKAFWRPTENSNLAARFRYGSSDSESLTNYYYLGGFENVRGYLDGQIRSQEFWQLNAEYRYSLLREKWYYLQVSGFSDVLQAIHPDSPIEQDNNDLFSSAGIGLRIGSPKIYRFNLRMDLAIFTSHPATSRFSVGVQQFF